MMYFETIAKKWATLKMKSVFANGVLNEQDAEDFAGYTDQLIAMGYNLDEYWHTGNLNEPLARTKDEEWNRFFWGAD